MKKIVLLFVAVVLSIGLHAQRNNTISIPGMPASIPEGSLRKVESHAGGHNNHHNTAKKTTSGMYNNWFDYWNQNYTSSSNLYSFVTYPDSNIKDVSSSTPYFVYCHGMGMSFDPTDQYYYTAAATSTITDPPITPTQNYTIDSFRFPYQYTHNYTAGSGTDSLIVELFVTTLMTGTVFDSGTYTLKFNPNASFYPITTDSTPRFATALYTATASPLGQNECWDSIKAQKQRYAFPLTTSTYTTMQMGLTTPLVVNAGQKVVSFIHFKSANAFSLGTTTSAANYLTLFAGSTAGVSTWPQQQPHSTSTGYPGSYQTGLIAQNQSRYHTGGGFTFAGHDVLIPGVAFNAPILAVTQEAFHVSWSAAVTGITNVCVGSTTTLSISSTGGTWSSGTTSVATVNPTTGVVYGVSAGTSVISYTIGSATSTTTVTVVAPPATATFTGSTTICAGSSSTLVPSVTGGSWLSSATGVATVNTTGVVTGVSAGSSVISYSISNMCGTAIATTTVTVNPTPSAGTISGTDTICQGHTSTLTVTATGGTWSSANTAIATVSAGGVVTGVSGGLTSIRYIVTNTLCSDTASTPFYVHCTAGVGNVNGTVNGMEVYPNPNTGDFNLTVTAPLNENVDIVITNLTGQTVQTFTIVTNKPRTVQLNQPAGMYFISAKLPGGTVVEKITLMK